MCDSHFKDINPNMKTGKTTTSDKASKSASVTVYVFTSEQIQKLLREAGYYLGCAGCDIDERHSMERSCEQIDMINHLTQKLNEINT